MAFNESASDAPPPPDAQSGARLTVRDLTAASRIKEEERKAVFKTLLEQERCQTFAASHQPEIAVEPLDYAKNFCARMGINYCFDNAKSDPGMTLFGLGAIIHTLIHNLEGRLDGHKVTNIGIGKIYKAHRDVIHSFLNDFWLWHKPEDKDFRVVLNKLVTFSIWLDQTCSDV